MTQLEDFPNTFTFPKEAFTKTKTVIFSELIEDDVNRQFNTGKVTFNMQLFEEEYDRIEAEKAQQFVDFFRDLLPEGLFSAIADIMAKEV